LFSFFKKRHRTEINFSFLQTDIHSHLIAGIDDGAKTVEDAIEMVKALKKMGFKKIITTPHIFGDYYPNTPDNIRSGLTTLKATLTDAGVDIDLEVAAEYYVDDYFENLLATDVELLSFSDQKILIEFSTLSEPVNIHNTIFSLNTRGYHPILAHPERYLYYENNFKQFEKIRSMGCSLQVNLLSLAGYYGSSQKKLGVKLLKAGLVDYLGTDLHRQSQLQYLRDHINTSILKLLTKNTFKNNQL